MKKNCYPSLYFPMLLLSFLLSALNDMAYAANWTKLHENAQSKLMIDQQSMIERENLKKAWLKIEYKTPQKNFEDPEKIFNLSKVLWFFDCPAQKSATSQVVQYLNNDMVFSAGIDVKKAEFIEPVPETDVDIAMRYVCAEKKKEPEKAKTAEDPKANIAKGKDDKTAPDATKATKESTEATPLKETQADDSKDKEIKNDIQTSQGIKKETTSALKKGNSKNIHWEYEGKEGPENWGKLSEEFATCDIGRNQSPIDIDNTIHALMKPIRWIQKFPAKDIVNNGHTVQVSFKEGNMLVLDNMPFQLKQVHFHAPSENTIRGKSFPLEAHFVHADSKGNLTVIGVMFKEDKTNPALAALWSQLPKEAGEPIALKSRFIPSELIPQNGKYYRFSGSLTTPPCSEGVRWVMMKTPVSVSKEQIKAFETVIKHHNNRPVQLLNGRTVLE